MTSKNQVVQASAAPRINLGVTNAIAAQLAPLAGTIADAAALAAEVAARLSEFDALYDEKTGITLTRDQKRTLFANFVYSVVMSLILVAVLNLIDKNESDATVFAVVTTMTGWSVHSIAKVARNAAFRVFDHMNPA